MSGRVVKMTGWQRRKARVRKKISGTPETPRLNVYRSNKHIYAQVIDDTAGRTLVAASSASGEIAEAAARVKKTEAGKLVGELIAKRARDKGIEAVVFDRSGYLYHGRVKALADGARSGGLKF